MYRAAADDDDDGGAWRSQYLQPKMLVIAIYRSQAEPHTETFIELPKHAAGSYTSLCRLSVLLIPP
jgi:hypothetical protein